MVDTPGLREGLVVASFGRHVTVETVEGKLVTCHPRGKRSEAVVGDCVAWLASEDEGTIERIEPRRNLFFRQDSLRTKSFAANLDQILILIAPRPGYSETQLAHALIAAEAQRIDPLIVLNKRDLGIDFELAWERLEPYRRIGYEVLPISLKHGTGDESQTLLQRLDGKTTLVLGPSGSGKSSMVNRLLPGAAVRTDILSREQNTGRHTTTRTSLYWLDRARGTALIDSPGFQAFGLHHLDAAQLAQCMPDFRPWLGQCHFHNCTHVHEPGCAILHAMDDQGEAGAISATRHGIYAGLLAELALPQRY